MADDDENNPDFIPPLPPGPPPRQPPPPPPRDLEFDIFMMRNFRIKECPPHITNAITHDPVQCPYIHPGQLCRRDLSDFSYSPDLCPLMEDCEDGDECEFAHNIYENCLHPSTFLRTRCCHGLSCTRAPCLFPHNPQRLRRATIKPPLYTPPLPPPPPPKPILPLPPNLKMPPPRPIQWDQLPPPRFSQPPLPFRPQEVFLPPYPLVLVQPRRMPPLLRPPPRQETSDDDEDQSGSKRKREHDDEDQSGSKRKREHDDEASTSGSN